MSIKVYCTCCGIQFTAQRSSAKYCSESCKQSAKRARQFQYPESKMKQQLQQIHTDVVTFKAKYINDKHSPDMQLELYETLDNIRFHLNKIEAVLGTIESAQENTWYQCKDCGQRTFGKVKKCDFCYGSDFKVVKV